MNAIVTGSKVSGDIVGGNKTIINYASQTQIEALTQNYEKEVQAGSQVQGFIDELTHYKSAKSDIRNLSVKFTEAGYVSLIDDGEELKELVSKLIIKHQNYRSAQKIITLLLAEAESIFNCEIKPKLTPEMTVADVNKLIRDHLVVRVNEMLGGNVLEIFNRQINGMIFFLTGNCHLEWR